jgi:starch-binding outer membrane protein, SusD/RagB family
MKYPLNKINSMKNIRYISAILSVLLIFSSCKKMLEEKPYDFVTPSQLDGSDASAQLLINGCYNMLTGDDYIKWEIYYKQIEFDNDYVTGPDWLMKDFAAGNFSSFDNSEGLLRFWRGPYTLIDRCSNAISAISAMNFDAEHKNNYMGQAYLMRAWAYFQLVRGFGAVPLFKQTVSEGAAFEQPRTPIKDVYDYIIENLKLAEQNMVSNKNAIYLKGRPSKGAASALLAKVYATMASSALSGAQVTVKCGPAATRSGTVATLIAEPESHTFTKSVVAGYEVFDAATYFALARHVADSLIKSNEYALFDNFEDVWKEANLNTGEHIWGLQSISESSSYGSDTNVFLWGLYDSNNILTSGMWVKARLHWYELFEAADYRITKGVLHRWKVSSTNAKYSPPKDSDIVQSGAANPYGWQTTDWAEGLNEYGATLSKFETPHSTVSINTFNLDFIRYADVLLLFAEADNEVNHGPTQAAVDAVNLLRHRNNASNVSVTLDQQAFRSFIIEERAREFALEGDRRWDLLRWGIYLPVMNSIDIDENNLLKRRQEKHLLFPIPTAEIDANNMLKGHQNPGW